MGGFLNALSFLAPVAPAAAQAEEIRRQRMQQAEEFQQRRSALSQEEETRNLQQEEARQRIRKSNAPTFFGEPKWDSTKNQYLQMALDPTTNRIVNLPVPGEDPWKEKSAQYAAERKAYKDVVGEEPSSAMDNAIFSSVYGVKLSPTGQRPQLKEDPSTGQFSWVYPPDENGQVPPPVPVRDADKRPFGGFKPNTVTIRKGVYHFIGEDNQVHEVPVTTETTKIYGTSAQANSSPESTGKPPSLKVRPPSGGGKLSPAGVQDQTGVPAYPGRSLGRAKLSPTAQKTLSLVNPAIEQTEDLMGRIRQMGLDKNNTPGYLTMARAKYGLGIASPEGSLGSEIANLSLASIKDATAALQGGSRALMALSRALEHTPNPWVDSPAMLMEKLTNIDKAMRSMQDDALRGNLPAVPKKTDPAVDQFLMSIGGK